MARTGSARLALPAGTTVPQGEVLLDGVVVPFTVEAADTGSTLVLPFPSGTSRTLRIHVTTPQRAGQSLPFALTVATAGSSEPLGTVVVRVGMVSLEVPEASADGTVVVNGFAPAGARVEVREADRVVVEAVAGVGGRWQATADLGSPGGDRVRHWLSARSTVGSLELQSGLRSVVVDAYASRLDSVTMQLGGAVHTFRTADGVARFPAVWSAGTAVVVTARFTGPVSEPKALLGSLSTVLTPVAGQPGAYRGSVSPKAVETGDLTITFEPERDRPPLPVPPAPAPEDSLIDPATLVVLPPLVTGSVVEQTFTASAPKLGPKARITGTLEIERLPFYTPTPEERAQAARSGVLAYGSLISGGDPRTATNGRYSAVAASIVDAEWLRSQASPELRRTLTTFAAADAAFRIGFKYAFELATNADQVYSVSQFKDKYDLVADLQKMALNCSSSDASAAYQKRAETLLQQALALDVFTAVSAAAGLVLAPATFGLGTVAVWAVTWAMGKALELKLQDNMEALQRALVSDPECRYEDSDGPAQRADDGPAAEPPGGDGPTAQPEWVYDPSGRVYEGLPTRPVAGVTATVLRSTSADGPWQVWDAAPYDQRNPQLTGDRGGYAWDVPQGWWKVRWEGAGWLPAESRPLKVLPPQTDVDQSLVRAELATVGSATADPTGITVGFTQPVRVSVASRPGMLSAGTATGRWEPVAPQVAPGGEQLALAYRFVAASPLSGSVPVRVDGAVQDHAGRALADAWSQSVTVGPAPADRTPPTVTVTGVKAGERYVLGAAPAPACRTVDDGSGVRTPAALAVTGGSPAGVGRYTATCSGAVDKAGNAATASARAGRWRTPSPGSGPRSGCSRCAGSRPARRAAALADHRRGGHAGEGPGDGRPVQPPLQRRRHRR